jgi:hypothetical protein
MGIGMRTGSILTLDLSTKFWKQLVGQQINASDINMIDKSIQTQMKNFQICDEQAFIDQNHHELTWTMMLSD